MPTTTASPPAIELSGVGKRFADGTEALHGLSLAIDRGSFTCLVGPSGCGKSTALRIIAGLASASSGSIRWSPTDGAEPNDHAIGFVFQEPTLMPWLRVRDNVRLPLRLQGVGRAESERRVDEALERVGLGDFAGSFPRQLSGGMKMRVSIARALVTEPRVLLMDEPFAALDEQTRSRLNDDLLRLWRENGWTVVFVTHSVYESVYLADRVVVMADRPGRVVADIAVDEPRPRDESFRRSPKHAELCGAVSAELAAASGGGDAR